MLSESLKSAVPELVISPLQATYLTWLDFSFMELNEKDLKDFVIHKAGLGLNNGPMFGPGGGNHQRLNIATPADVLKEGIRRLEEAMQATR